MSSDDKKIQKTTLRTGATDDGHVSLDDISTRISIPTAGKLTIVEGPGAGTSLPINGTSSLIGRDETNHIQLDFGDDTVHRKGHAAIECRKGAFRLFPKKGGNPVAVNGKDVSGDCPLAFGDLIVIGLTTLRLDKP